MNPKTKRRPLCRCCESAPGTLGDPHLGHVCSECYAELTAIRAMLEKIGAAVGPATGDFTGRIWSFRYAGGTVSDFQDITSQLFPTRIGNHPLVNPVAFWEDNRGELYIVSYGNGNIYKILR